MVVAAAAAEVVVAVATVVTCGNCFRRNAICIDHILLSSYFPLHLMVFIEEKQLEKEYEKRLSKYEKHTMLHVFFC